MSPPPPVLGSLIPPRAGCVTASPRTLASRRPSDVLLETRVAPAAAVVAVVAAAATAACFRAGGVRPGGPPLGVPREALYAGSPLREACACDGVGFVIGIGVTRGSDAVTLKSGGARGSGCGRRAHSMARDPWASAAPGSAWSTIS